MRTHLLGLIGVAASATLTLAAVAAPATTAAAAATTSAPTNALTGSTVRHGWTATHTLALHPQGTSLGALPHSHRLTVSVALPLRHRDQIDHRIAATSDPSSSSYRHFLTPTQVRRQYGPTQASVTAVERYLRQHGFTGVHASSNRLLVTASGTAGQAERTFSTHLAQFRVHGQKVFANTRAASVPNALSGKVSAVLGLSNLAMTQHVGAKTAAPNLSGFKMRAIQRIYDAHTMKAASNTQLAILAIGDQRRIIKNLRIAERAQHFPQTPVTVHYTAPMGSIKHGNPLTGSVEWDLDTQISSMVAQKLKLLHIYDIATFTDSDVARGINAFVAANKASALSASLGECDFLAYSDGAMVTTDEALAEGALQGQSMFASTGDNGSFCPEGASTGVPGGGPGQSWPAIGEYTTAVGGTTVVADESGNVSNEIAWVGGGGGISAVGTAGPWTYQANTAGQAEEYNNFGGRGVPDIAAMADGNTGPLIYTGPGDPEEVGGTSVSSPLVMGLWGRIEEAHHGRIGLASYRFYHLYNRVNPATVTPGLVPTYVANANPQPVPGFRDITVGSNGGNVAKPGYDYTTGIGAPLTQQLSKALGDQGFHGHNYDRYPDPPKHQHH